MSNPFFCDCTTCRLPVMAQDLRDAVSDLPVDGHTAALVNSVPVHPDTPHDPQNISNTISDLRLQKPVRFFDLFVPPLQKNYLNKEASN